MGAGKEPNWNYDNDILLPDNYVSLKIVAFDKDENTKDDYIGEIELTFDNIRKGDYKAAKEINAKRYEKNKETDAGTILLSATLNEVCIISLENRKQLKELQ